MRIAIFSKHWFLGVFDNTNIFRDKCLCAFDCLIICTQDTLGQEEIDFAIQSLKYNQPIAFVRSRCDIVLDNAKKCGDIKTINQEAVVNELKKSMSCLINYETLT